MSGASITSDWQQERGWLGYAGLLPFIGGLAILLSSDSAALTQLATDALRHYAAVIASFLGAVHWGVAHEVPQRRRQAHLRWGVIPALAAWGLLSLPTAVGLAGFAALFALISLVDQRLLPVLDQRYRQLRLQLSAVVIAVLGAAAVIMARTTG